MSLTILSSWDFWIGVLVAFVLFLLISILWDWAFWRRRLEEYQSEVGQLQDALNRALTGRAEAQQQADASGVRAAQAQARVRELEQLQAGQAAQRASLVEELEQARVRLRQMTAIEQANETLRGKLSAAENRLREQDVRHTQLEQALQVVKQDQQTTMVQLREGLAAAEAQLQALTAENETLRDRLATAEVELATVGAYLDTAAEDAEGMQAAQSRWQAAQREIESLRGNLAAATARAERLAALEPENTELQNRLEALENDLLTENNRLVAAEVKLQNLADQLTDERLRNQMLEKRLVELQSQPFALHAPATMPIFEPPATAAGAETEPSAAAAENASAAGATPTAAAPALPEGTTAARTHALPDDEDGPTEFLEGITGGDRLQAIKGIGNVFARRLREAAVYSYADLAAQTPQRLAEIVQAKPWQRIEPEAWIAEARRLAAGGDAA